MRGLLARIKLTLLALRYLLTPNEEANEELVMCSTSEPALGVRNEYDDSSRCELKRYDTSTGRWVI